MNTLCSYEEVCALIDKGDKLLLAGDKDIIEKLPKGNWMAGTISYFMSGEGGIKTNEKIFTTIIPKEIIDFKITTYAESELCNIPKGYFKNGFSFIIIPSFSSVHTSFAENCISYENIFDSPLVGWVAGFDLERKDIANGIVYNGSTGESFSDRAIVMHLVLEKNKKAKMNNINLFKQGNGDIISFDQKGFNIKSCNINGEESNFAKYLIENEVDISLPLVSEFRGFSANVSFKSINQELGIVELYASVFPDTEYRVASPIGIYEDEFNDEVLKNNINPFFSCNCILNYLYANLEGKKTGKILGPMTFGEIAHILLNQTMVYISFEDV